MISDEGDPVATVIHSDICVFIHLYHFVLIRCKQFFKGGNLAWDNIRPSAGAAYAAASAAYIAKQLKLTTLHYSKYDLNSS